MSESVRIQCLTLEPFNSMNVLLWGLIVSMNNSVSPVTGSLYSPYYKMTFMLHVLTLLCIYGPVPSLHLLLFSTPSTLPSYSVNLFFVAGGMGLAPDHQTENRKLIFHRVPTAVRQIYVDIPSINGWKIDAIWCPWVEHEAAVGLLIQVLFLEDPQIFPLI